MLVKAMDIPVEKETALTGYEDEIPGWLQPYVAAAERAGLTANVETANWNWEETISAADAAVMVQNALDLQSEATGATVEEEALAVMAENGVELPAEGVLTRADGAKFLYRVRSLAVNAPGMKVLRAD